MDSGSCVVFPASSEKSGPVRYGVKTHKPMMAKYENLIPSTLLGHSGESENREKSHFDSPHKIES